MNHSAKDTPKVAFLWRGDPARVEKPTPQNNRLYPLFMAFEDLDVAAEAVAYSDESADDIRDRLLSFDGVLVWVDPITEGRDRAKLDPMLTELADHGVWVSAHPDLIQKIGTKEVLFRTKHFGWGTDTYLYATATEFNQQFPARLRSNGPRVLKQRRGNGGIGTFKVDVVAGKPGADDDLIVRVQEAHREAVAEELRFGDFVRRCEKYFAGAGCLIDQALQRRTDDGMIRCYSVQNEVVGFSTQMPRAPGEFAMAREKTMYEASEPRFAQLKTRMETEWVPELLRMFDLTSDSLPAIWDADFLFGPKDNRGRDTYVLGEINISAVFPFPETAATRIAQSALAGMRAFRELRSTRTS
jgi:uncharacterized protein DUF6815